MSARKIAIFLILMALLVSMASANPVFVAGDQDGQGFLLQRESDCYLITAQHLLGEAREAILVDDRSARHHALLERTAEPGLAILRVPGIGGCASSFPDGGELDRLLQTTGEARLTYRTNSGAISSIGVEIIASDERYIRVRAENSERLYRGIIGSPLMIGDSTAGMLQSVDADSGTG